MIIANIQTLGSQIPLETIPQLINPIIEELDSYISGLTPNKLAQKAIKEISKDKVYDCLKAYISNPELKKKGIPLDGYIKKSIRVAALPIIREGSTQKLKVCSFCKFLGVISVLKGNQVEGARRNYICNPCTNSDSEKAKYFATQSYQGGNCYSCNHWVPVSIFNQQPYIACPYCSVEICVLDIKRTSKHPSIHLNDSIVFNKDYDFNIFADKTLSQPPQDQDALEKSENMAQMFTCYEEAIAKLIRMTPFHFRESTQIQRVTMYQAFRDVLNTKPEELLAYLSQQDRGNYDNIKAILFRDYARKLVDRLPFKITKTEMDFLVTSIDDPLLSLYTGTYSFWGEIDKNGVLVNQTPIHYIGKNKDYGPYYLGKLLEVKDSEGESLLSEVEDYSFTRIFFNSELAGTMVSVEHLGILSHPQMESLSYMHNAKTRIAAEVKKVMKAS